jgi:hypothetical protein
MSVLQAVKFSANDVRSVNFSVKKSGKIRVVGRKLPAMTISPTASGFECRVGPKKALLSVVGKTAESAYRAGAQAFWM